MKMQTGPKGPKEKIYSYDVNLSKNRILSSSLPEQPDFIQERMPVREDYRQMMLSYVLKYVYGPDRDKVIQHFLPERLDAYLNHHASLDLTFHVDWQEEKHFCKIRAKREKDITNITVQMDIPEEEVQKDAAKSRSVVLVKASEETSGLLKESLGDRCELLKVENAAEAATRLTAKKDANLICVWEGVEPQIYGLCRKQNVPLIAVVPEEKIEESLQCGAMEILRMPVSGSEVKFRFRSLEERRNYLETIAHLEIDELTGLYVGTSFIRRAEELLKKGDEEYQIIVFSIEDFTLQGEKYGKAVGDMILKHVADSIQTCVPDVILGGRTSASEFIILRSNEAEAEYNSMIPYVLKGSPIPDLSVKAGYVRADGKTPFVMLCGRARTALMKIMKVYGVNAAEYNEVMYMEGIREHQILGSMEAALENDEFKVYYQPRHDTKTGKPIGAEALVRWYHPTLGQLNPGQFIPIFERVGFIRGMDRYLWTRVCMDLRRRLDAGRPVVPVSVNLSRRDFETNDLAEWFLMTTARFDIDHKLLHLEITESAYTADEERITECIHRLHAEGFVIELDDFGTGYSSLMCVNNPDIDVLKIDRSIVQEMQGKKRTVMEFCTKLAAMMGMKTVAEGVETEAQYHRAQNFRCDEIQGFYFSQAISYEEFDRYLVRYYETDFPQT